MNILTQPGCEYEKPAKAHASNLETIINAAKADRLALLECVFNATNERVAVLVAVNKDKNDYKFVPLAVLLNGNPYEMLTPPQPT